MFDRAEGGESEVTNDCGDEFPKQQQVRWGEQSHVHTHTLTRLIIYRNSWESAQVRFVREKNTPNFILIIKGLKMDLILAS